MRPSVAFVVAATLMSLLAACGRGEQTDEPVRPVLVVRPGIAAGPESASYAGEVRAREESALSFRIGGNLIRREVDVGARVGQGQVLAELDPGDQRLQTQAAQAQLAAAEAELNRAQADRTRYAQLVDQQLISRSAMDAQDTAYRAAAGQVEAARAELDVARNQTGYTRLLAPRDGVIVSRQAEAGQVVAAGQAVYTLAGETEPEIAIAIPESRVQSVAVGQPARIELWSAPGTELSGRIREIAPAADPQARTYAARVALDADALAHVQLGQSARVHLLASDDAETATLSVPLSAIQRSGDGATIVWVVDPASGRLISTPVRIGPYGKTTVPVFEGLSPSDWVVSAGGHVLRDGQPVAPVDRDNRPIEPASAKPDSVQSR